MKRIVFLAIFFFPVFSFAQLFPFDLWHEGKIVLESGDTLKGSVKYDLQDLLLIKYSGHLESFSARKILLFEIYDQTYRRYRQFYSLPYSPSGGYKTPIFFEVLSEGKITLLSREKVEVRSYSYSPYMMYNSYNQRKVLAHTYYTLKENGDIELFKGGKNAWYDLMGNKADDVHAYVKEYKLDFDNKYQLKSIIDYYNSTFTHK